MGLFSSLMGSLGFGSSDSDTDTSSTTTVTPWSDTAAGSVGSIGGTSADLADLLGTQLTNYELPYQQSLYSANSSMLPYQTASNVATNLDAIRDIFANQGVKDTIRDSYTSELESASPVISKFYQEALNGEDPTKAANEAEADVIRTMNKSKDAYMQNLGSYGINANKLGGAERAFDLATAENIVGARSQAKDDAQEDSWTRLVNAMSAKNSNTGLSGLSSLLSSGNNSTYSTNSTISDIISALSTGGTAYSTLLNPQSTTTTGSSDTDSSAWSAKLGFGI